MGGGGEIRPAGMKNLKSSVLGTHVDTQFTPKPTHLNVSWCNYHFIATLIPIIRSTRRTVILLKYFHNLLPAKYGKEGQPAQFKYGRPPHGKRQLLNRDHQ